MRRFEGKSVVVTGAGSGMGQQTALAFVREGAAVLGVDINADGLAATAEAATAEAATAEAGAGEDSGGQFSAHVADISQRDRCRETIATAVDEFGGVDVLVNVAGIIRMNNFVDVTEAELDLMMGVNLYGSMWLCQAAIPHLLERSGNIVNIASNAGLMGQAYCSVYASSKAAVINFTRSLAMEYVKTPIRVNCVAPGGTQTPMATQMNFPEGVDFKLVERYMGFRRLADPALVANAILFVASDEAAAVHGSIFSVDSGITAG